MKINFEVKVSGLRLAYSAVMKVETDDTATCDKMSKWMQEAIDLFKMTGTRNDKMLDRVTMLYDSGYHMHAKDYQPILSAKICSEIKL